MVKRTKTPAYVKKLEERNKLLVEKNRIDARLAEIKRDLDGTVARMRTTRAKKATRELFTAHANLFGNILKDMTTEAFRQQRHLLAQAQLERPSNVYERAQAVQGGNGGWHCSKCLKGCYYDGRCGDGAILMCECNAAEDRQYDNERR